MWTNIFKIGGLHQLSWFQFFPNESDLNPMPEKSGKQEQKDAATQLVLSTHLRLQRDGFLCTWTNSFVGPWDPSQGLHNPDEKIKLWLFLPGRHSSVVDSAQAAVSRLRVLASGLWLAPGDSEEIAAALSQALRNRIERAMIGLSYMRFGDVFSKYHPFLQSEELLRKGKPVVEFVFSATEETLFVHVIISAKHVRALLSSDLETILNRSSSKSSNRLPVIVSPHGMHGMVTGCCPSDLVRQVYLRSSKFKNSNGIIGLPYHVSQNSSCQLRGQNCYVEVTIGCAAKGHDKALQAKNSKKSLLYGQNAEFSTISGQKGSLTELSVYEKTFIYPVEAVLVPIMQASFARSSLLRFWLQNWVGPSLSSSAFSMHSAGEADSLNLSWVTIQIRSDHDFRSSSNSNSSSLSSISSTSSDSDHKMASGVGDLEADADSLTSRLSGFTSNDQFPSDRLKLGSKRPRSQAGTSMQDPYKSNYGSEANNLGISANDVGLQWDWEVDNRGMDIQALLSEFGDFGDFFETDELSLGEPPGTVESPALAYPVPDSGDVGSGPSTAIIDVTDQMVLSTGFPSFDNFSMSPVLDESVGKNQEGGGKSILPHSTPASSAVECVDLMRAEAMMTFAPEYGAVEASTSEFSTSIVKSPYIPKSRIVETANSSSKSYVYGATPPSSPCLDGSDEKPGVVVSSKAFSGKHDPSSTSTLKKYYNVVESTKEQHKKGSFAGNNGNARDEATSLSPLSGLSCTDAAQSVQRKIDDSCEVDNMILSTKTMLAKEDDCLMFQATMCRLRHTLSSSSSFSPMSTGRVTESTVLSQLHGEPSSIIDNVFSKYEVKKKETIPVRIAGDFDGGLLDGPLSAPVGVWRSVGAIPKGAKPMMSQSIDMRSSLPSHSSKEEGILSYGQRQPLYEFLDGLALLVQQATSFVDVALDGDCGDGPYGWLALQEQKRRGFGCGPSMMHAGCGGSLASCHALDIAGVELADPLLADVHASSVIGLMQSDIRTALRSSFRALDGPLSITDWCKGRSQLSDSGITSDGFSVELTGGECRDSSSTPSLSLGESLSPPQSSAVGSPCLKDGIRVDETSQQLSYSLRPTMSVIPLPAVLVGYQDDWLKTSATSLQLWEKAPFEPYASQKPMTYCVVCPDIDPLTTAAADFFQQLGTVYETCKLGTHLPQPLGNQMEIDSGKLSSAGFVLLDCPQSMKIESNSASLVGSISDYFLSLSNGWDLTSYLKSLSKVLKALRLGSCLTSNPKEGNSGPCTVIYVVCPFPDSTAILQTVVESSIAVGSVILSADKDRRSIVHNLVGKALSCSTSVDEASISNVLTLSGFIIPKLVLHIVTVDAIFRVTSPAVNELVILKETAFTVYNKARRISRRSSSDVSSSVATSSRSDLMQVSSPNQGMWKETVGPRSLQREGHHDPSLRSGGWDNSWHSIRSAGLGSDPHRNSDFLLQEEARYMFEPLFILAEPGSLELGISPLGNGNTDECSSGTVDASKSSQTDGSELDHQKSFPSMHCCYGWTEDWRWLVCIWTDSRGELLDSHIFPFGGISSRQDTKGLQSLFVQMLQQGCQILQACSSDTAMAKSRDLVITRIGCFYELECQEWQKALYSVGGSEVKKWPIHLRRSAPDGVMASSNGPSLQDQEMNLIQERNLTPNPLYNSHSKASSFVKSGMGQPSSRKQLMGGSPVIEHNNRGLLQWAQSITFVSVSVDHSLHLIYQADSASPGASGSNPSSYIEGFTPVKSLGDAPASYVVIPSPSMRFLPPSPLQLPTCLTAESPPLAHLLHSKGSAVPLCTGFVISKAVPSMRKDSRSNAKEEWPSVLRVGLVDYYGGSNIAKEKIGRGMGKQETRDFEIETHLILESVIPEFHALSWLTVSPAYLDRRTALPFHCDMVLRLGRLLHFADKELSKKTEKIQV